MLPVGSRATPWGEFSCAAVAGPLSPVAPGVPVPAMVEMVWVAASILRMRWLAVSAMKTLPLGSMAIELGAFSWAAMRVRVLGELGAQGL